MQSLFDLVAQFLKINEPRAATHDAEPPRVNFRQSIAMPRLPAIRAANVVVPECSFSALVLEKLGWWRKRQGTRHAARRDASAGRSVFTRGAAIHLQHVGDDRGVGRGGSEPFAAGGIVSRDFTKSSATERPLHCRVKYSPASGVANVPFMSVLPWQTAHDAS